MPPGPRPGWTTVTKPIVTLLDQPATPGGAIERRIRRLGYRVVRAAADAPEPAEIALVDLRGGRPPAGAPPGVGVVVVLTDRPTEVAGALGARHAVIVDAAAGDRALEAALGLAVALARAIA
jgi:hypothetical protein